MKVKEKVRPYILIGFMLDIDSEYENVDVPLFCFSSAPAAPSLLTYQLYFINFISFRSFDFAFIFFHSFDFCAFKF